MVAGTPLADNGSGADVATRAEATTYYNQLMAIADKRKDVVVFYSPTRADVVDSGAYGFSVMLEAAFNCLALNN
jgi:hypothetical protein